MKGKTGRLVFGFGINDSDYITQKYEQYTNSSGKRTHRKVWTCPYYMKWVDMIRRVYSERELKRYPTYRGCSICEEWKYFSNFKRWVDEQPDRNWQEKHLDKDFLCESNKIYSQDTCIFISSLTNTFISDCGSARGEFALGVSIDKGCTHNPFRARCQDPLKRYSRELGFFPTEQQAHEAWKNKKHEYALELAELEHDSRIKEALRTKYL